MMNKSSVDVPDKIIQMIRTRGYVIPTDITRELKINSIFAGAHLSEMVDSGKLKISSTKVGSSPAYYLPETASSLQNLEKYLNEKDRKTFQILRENKVLREIDLGPLIQVSLRNLKDFAVPLRVNKQEIFWKFYLVSDDEAAALIKTIIDKDNELAMQEPAVHEEAQAAVEKEAPKVTPQEPAVSSATPAGVAEKKEVAASVVEQKKKIAVDRPKAKKKEKPAELKKEKEIQTKITEREAEPEQTVKVEKAPIKSEFYDKIASYCERKKIKILDAELIKKGDIEMMIEVPTVIGNVRYFAKARDKKRSNDGDLSSAYVRGQTKNLPTVFITTGKVTKKALEMVGNDFKQMIVKEI